MYRPELSTYVHPTEAQYRNPTQKKKKWPGKAPSFAEVYAYQENTKPQACVGPSAKDLDALESLIVASPTPPKCIRRAGHEYVIVW